MRVFDNVVAFIRDLGSPVAVKASLDGLAVRYSDSYTWKDMEVELNAMDLVPGILGALSLPHRLKPQEGDEQRQEAVEQTVAKAILPDSSEEQTDDQIANRMMGLEAYRATATRLSIPLTQRALLALTAFTYKPDLWTTPEIFSLVDSLLASQVLADGQEQIKSTLIVQTILKHFIRPLFSRSKPAAITSSARKAEYPDADDRSGLPDASPEAKPWKYTVPYAITVFDWAVTHSDEALVSENWPLYIPVLVTLVEDPDTKVRSRGLGILTVFLSKFPNKTLAQTGLGDVFTEAVVPTLSYLPSLTPPGESVQLLGPAYVALLVLSRKLFPNHRHSKEKGQYLDKFLREGIFTSFDHAKEHPNIVEVLVEASSRIVDEMGIYSVKHLKYLLSMYSNILIDPFAAAHPPTILVATKALQTVLSNCWPRMIDEDHQNVVIKMLSLAWANILDDEHLTREEPEVLAEIKAELRKVALMLGACMTQTAGVSLEERIKPLLKEEPRLDDLFAGTDHDGKKADEEDRDE